MLWTAPLQLGDQSKAVGPWRFSDEEIDWSNSRPVGHVNLAVLFYQLAKHRPQRSDRRRLKILSLSQCRYGTVFKASRKNIHEILGQPLHALTLSLRCGI